MTPMIDHAKDRRRRLIDGTWTGCNQPLARLEYQKLIAEGFSEHAASIISGWRELDDRVVYTLDRITRSPIITIAKWALFILILAGAIRMTSAMAQPRPSDAELNESVFIDCLNNREIVLSDGSRWFCYRLLGEELK